MASKTIVGFGSTADFNKVVGWARTAKQNDVMGTRPPRASGIAGGDDVAAVGLYNGEATDCPAFGIMLHNGVQSTSSGIVIKGKRPDVYGCQKNFLIATSEGVKAGKGGSAQGIGPWGPDVFIAAYDNSDGTPAVGEYWGNRSGTYLFKKNSGGFIVIGIYDSTNHYVLVKSEPMYNASGSIAADLGPGASGDVTIKVSGVSTSQTINAMNDSGCTLLSAGATNTHTIEWVWSRGLWLFVVGKT